MEMVRWMEDCSRALRWVAFSGAMNHGRRSSSFPACVYSILPSRRTSSAAVLMVVRDAYCNQRGKMLHCCSCKAFLPLHEACKQKPLRVLLSSGNHQVIPGPMPDAHAHLSRRGFRPAALRISCCLLFFRTHNCRRLCPVFYVVARLA